MHFNREDYETDQEAIADALFAIAHELSLLGNAGAISEHGTTIGAIELSMTIRHGLSDVAEALREARRDP